MDYLMVGIIWGAVGCIVGAVIGAVYIINRQAEKKERAASAERMMHHFVCREHYLTWADAVPGISYAQAEKLYYMYEKMKVRYQAMNATLGISPED